MNIADWVWEQTGGVVQSGPFQGMRLVKDKSWKNDDLSPKLLGCYEEELHGVIEQEISRLAIKANPRIVNIGCAEGFYAVGLSRRLPNATVYIVDIDDQAIRIAGQAAELNGVELQTGFIDQLIASADLIVIDAEGAEVEYLNLRQFPSLKDITIICEVHNLPPPQSQATDQILIERFRDTHIIEVVFEGARNPNKYPFLHGCWSVLRWMAVNEGRPCLMAWFVMRPRRAKVGETVRQCGECNLCCKLERVNELSKPRNQWCHYCDFGKGCKIHGAHPKACQSFKCMWLTDQSMPDEWRPDKTGCYAVNGGDFVKVVEDTDADNEPFASKLVAYLTEKGRHVLNMRDNSVTFIAANNQDPPQRIMLDWTL